MVRWVVGSNLHGGSIELFLVPTRAPHPVYGMVQMKEPLLLIRKSSPCSGSSGFPLSLSVRLSLSVK